MNRLNQILLLTPCLAIISFAALAQGSALNRGRDTNQPIEIGADNLEVLQDQQIAIFKGNVDAVQGTMRLRADMLKVYYRQNKPDAAPTRPGGPKPAAQPASADATGSISRIDATGKVFISSPEETAQGDSGVYDVDKLIMTLDGNVVITRDTNVLRGDHAVTNMETGRSEMQCKPGTNCRVRGIFQPNAKPGGQ